MAERTELRRDWAEQPKGQPIQPNQPNPPTNPTNQPTQTYLTKPNPINQPTNLSQGPCFFSSQQFIGQLKRIHHMYYFSVFDFSYYVDVCFLRDSFSFGHKMFLK